MRFRICSGRNFLLLFAFLILYSFIISPALIWYNRDQKYDLYNVYQKSEVLTFNLYNCHAPKKSSQSRFNCSELWVNDSIPYKANKYILNKSFEIPIISNIRENLTNIYLLLKVKQKNCNSGCPVLQQTSKILHWFLPQQDVSRILISNGPSPTPKPSPTPIPFRYRTTRFDLLDHEIVNTETLTPWAAKHLASNRKRQQFHPILAIDTFFDIPTERRSINMSLPNFTVNVEINIRRDFVWNAKSSIQFSLDLFADLFNTDFLVYNFNEMKRIFVETNPVLLWTTGIATILHFIFQVLAFEKDLEFWTRKESLIGISLRTILLQLGGQIILFLNILESRKIPMFMKVIDFLDICMQVWKIMRLAKISKRFPFFKVRKEYRGSTDEADAAGLKYLSYALVPLVIGYSIYQLFNVKYRSVKQYILHCLSGAVYSFGFLAMLPQLYVNYKLKTVAGMSRSAFVYKFISTFIDDLYTFVSDLPLMYKIACFRDDVVFFVWIFQCFIYPVDPTRVNEFGFVEKTEDSKNNECENDKQSKEGEEEKETKEEIIKDRIQETVGQKIKTD
ncbi:hypothetical protein M9Y10_021567 [Tritrichomonas musculus]|uniref:Uncharacterized protein n=1 Tax=Tritrichomonas musculus TaxID=1915356 RepID=A0ABR2KPU0_9EUKA